jgi:Protein of unknown function (DUF4236)
MGSSEAALIMSLRFRRSLRIAPGVRLNLGLHGAGLSVGPRGLHVGVNRRGIYSSAGIPGTGLYAVHHYHAPGAEHPEARGSGCGMLLIILAGAALVVALMFLTGLFVGLWPNHSR